MMLENYNLTIKGIPNNINHRKILKVSHKKSLSNLFSSKTIYISEQGKGISFSKHFLTDSKYKGGKSGVCELAKDFLATLENDDIISIDVDGTISKLWTAASSDNVLYTTDFCNSDCIMCPQVVEDKESYYDDACAVVRLLPKDLSEICISGGEPTLFKEQYLNLIQECKKELPEANYLVLTNGKNFEYFNFTKNVVLTAPRKTTYAIPIYSAISRNHDHIVNSEGSFKSTIKGIYNLYKFMQDIEIRIVIVKNNYKELNRLAHFIYWNLPFVRHVAFMGMETHGNAVANLEDIWVEPLEYMAELSKAITFLNMRMINVSIYNLPLCLIPRELWCFSRKSISDWKNIYMDSCNVCLKKERCAGFFATSDKIPDNIIAISK